MSSNDLQALFANLKPRSQDPASPGSATFGQQSSRQPTSTVFNTARMPSTPPPPFSSSAEDQSFHRTENANQGRVTSSSGATAQNLLSLLNFGGSQNAGSAAAQSDQAINTQARSAQSSTAPISASDLVARFMSPPLSAPKSEQNYSHIKSEPESSESRNPLLDLLSKRNATSTSESNGAQEQKQKQKQEEEQDKQHAEADIPVQSIEVANDIPQTTASNGHRDTPVRIFGTAASREHTPFEAPKSASPMPQDRKPIFSYTNPFEALNASRNQTPGLASPAPQPVSTPAAIEPQQTERLSTPDVISTRKKLTPKLKSQRSTSSAQPEQSPLFDRIQSLSKEQNTQSQNIESMQPSVETPAAAQAHEVKMEDVTVSQTNDMPKEAMGEDQDNDAGSGEWEDADGSFDKEDTLRNVPVYNFPIKAFVSITLQLGKSSDIGIRDDSIMEISRLKKEFDQLDRSLAAATAKYITYAFVKHGGLRIIRQDDGSDRHVFKNSHDRIFNVAFCTTAMNAPPSENQAVLGTGVSGAVYYATVSKEGNDLFEKNHLESESLIFPPYPQADENTAGGVLKTRAKRSSRHPEYFAIGRGKSILLIWPATALTPRYGITDTNRTVDVEKFYADRPLQISTGKAGKDFTFSEDDTLIVSLDKTGRLRFWDIRNLIDEANATAARVSPVIVDTPILSLSTASPAEKSWPTSVTFVDKARPYKKGGALRYVLVGLRQNHTLQLWDIALGKAVQELNFPHENETDGICSVSYHPESGIIVVSHPTRNSIFFIHLSAPRYSLSSQLSQASYVQRIAAKDPELPKPESTACMSGIREISFAEKGQLRSVELLSVQKSTDTPKDETAVLFELYVVHSKGVTCLGINREDLGWNTDNKVLYPVDALQEGLVTTKELKLGSVIEEPMRSKSPVREVAQPAKATKKKSKKAGQSAEETAVNGVEEAQQPPPDTVVASAKPSEVIVESEPTVQDSQAVKDAKDAKETKKAKKKAEKAEKAAQAAQAAEHLSAMTNALHVTSPPKDVPTQPNGGAEKLEKPEVLGSRAETTSSAITEELLDRELRKIEQAVSGGFKKEFDSLYQNIKDDRTAQEASSASRQEAILRLVSSSLSTNVEKSLSRILAQQMQQAVVPVVVQHASAQIAETLATVLHSTIPHEVGTHLPTAVNAALLSPQMSMTVAEAVSQKLSKQLETQISDMVVKTITPVFKSVATAAAEKASSETESRLSAQIRQLQIDRVTDHQKLDKLGSVLEGMATTLSAMSDSQVAFQGQILKDRQVLTAASGPSMINTTRQVSTARGTPDPAPSIRPKPMRIRSKADIELEEITTLMNEGKYEEGSIKWLQSTQPVKLFDELFVRFTPEYLSTDVSPLVAFSVAVTVANSLNTNTERRLEWISAAFDAVDLQDPEIADLSQHAPALITSLVQKLESLYMTIAERNPGDVMLKTIPQLAKKGRDIKAAFIAGAAGPAVPTFAQLASGSY